MAKLIPGDIINWLLETVNQAEADGYQQSERSTDHWYKSGPPEVVYKNANTMLVKDQSGNEFLVKVTLHNR